jgi:uncharacterized protein YcbX
MRVVELWRYPVKSLQGERLEAAAVTPEGLEGDRRWAIFDAETGLGLTARRVPQLLFAAARVRADGGVEITLPDGSIAFDDAALSAWLGRPVALRSAAAQIDRLYENPVDAEHEATSPWLAFQGAPGAFHDTVGARVSLVSTGTIGDWDRRRFRMNVLLDGEGEDALVGRRAALGDALLEVELPLERCVMVTRPQPGLDRDPQVLRTIARERAACLAVGALVVEPGEVRVGAELAAEPGEVAG